MEEHSCASVLLAAAVPLLLAPTALAADKEPAEGQSIRRVPDIGLSYDTETFAAVVSLPVSGCLSREHTQFILSASISRRDHEGGRDPDRTVAMCGPFRSADDFEDSQEPPQYFCNLGLSSTIPTLRTPSTT